MAKKRRYRTIDQVDEEYYRNHPDEIDSYLATAFEEYAKDGCITALLSSLRMIARSKR
jgi:DNA-binding phage protein